MTAAQLSFDFTAPAAPALHARFDFVADARAHWRVGMATSLPCFCTIEGEGERYTQMLPGVVETIADDLASVRIYAAPQYGYMLENYPLHQKLAIKVPLRDLGRYHGNAQLQRLAHEMRLTDDGEALAAKVHARRGAFAPAPACTTAETA